MSSLSNVEVTHPTTQRRHRRLRLRLHLLCVSTVGLALFPFCVFHGINQSDVFYPTELATAWVLAIGGGYSGVRAFKRGNRWQRVVALIGLALIASSMGVVTLLNRTPVSEVPKPSAVEIGE